MSVSRLIASTLVSACCALLLPASPAWAAAPATFSAGAAKIDITPPSLVKVNPNDFGDFAGVHDPLFARVLLVDNGRSSAAVIALDLNQAGDMLPLRQRIQKELGIPVDHVMISVTHNHSAPMLAKPSPGGVAKSHGPEVDAYTAFVGDRVVAALKQAKAALQPARMGYASGVADVNVNRDLYTPQGYKYGANLTGPSDKTVWVVKFESASGAPIAVLFNYGVHPVTTRRERMVSGDIPGAAERYVEHQFDDKVVALWTLGPAGDQDPKIYDLPPGAGTNATGTQRPNGFDVMNAQGFLIGAEAARVANQIKPTTASARIEGAERVFTCPLAPGAKKQQYFLTGGRSADEINAVPVRVGLILIDQVALVAVTGEVVTQLYYNMRKASSLSNTILVSMANDNAGYLIDDAAYDRPTAAATNTPAARGCVESGVVNGMKEMIETAMKGNSP